MNSNNITEVFTQSKNDEWLGAAYQSIQSTDSCLQIWDYYVDNVHEERKLSYLYASFAAIE